MPLDLLFTIPQFPKPGGKLDATDMVMQGGGPVPNALIGLSRLGCTASVIAVVGNDDIGRISAEELNFEQVDSSLVIRKNQVSDSALGFVEAGSGRRTICLYRKLRVTPRDLKTDRYPIPRIIHLDGRDLDACIKLARWGKKVGAIISFDIGSIRNDVTPILRFIDHLVVADSFALPFTGKRTAKSAIAALSDHCPGTIVVTEGLNGSLGMEAGQFRRQPAYKVQAVDTTGAGDAFHAGYLYGLLNGFDIADRLKWGAATGALKCRQPGARAGIARLPEVVRFLKGNPKTYA
jgi:ribokinase